MTISNKLKGLIKIKGYNTADVAKRLNMSAASLNNKFTRDTFTADDLVGITACLGCELAIIIDDKQKLTLDESDIKNNEG